MKTIIYVALTASILYFIVYVVLKYLLQNEIIDWQSALSGAIVFSFFIFVVHHFLQRTKQIPW